MNTRYFLISFNPSNKLAFGSISFESEGFFSYSEVLEHVKARIPDIVQIAIINIYEFSCKEDFDKYNSNG